MHSLRRLLSSDLKRDWPLGADKALQTAQSEDFNHAAALSSLSVPRMTIFRAAFLNAS
jgi:hypothetical protein